MPETTEGVASEAMADNSAAETATALSNAFDQALARQQDKAPQVDNDEMAPKEQKLPESKPVEKPAEKAVPEQKPEKPAEEPEFPSELMTGEKPEQKAEKDDLDEIVLSNKVGEQTRTNFDRLKAIAREARQQAQKFQKELETAKTSAPAQAVPDAEELKAAREKVRQMEELVERSQFTLSPKYQQIVAEGEQAIADAKEYLKGSEIDPAIIDMATRVTGAKRTQVLKDAGIDPETIALISPHLAAVDRAERNRVQALEQSKTWRAEQEAQAVAQQEAERAREREEEDRVFNEVSAEVDKAFEPFQKVPGADKWNAQVDRLNAEAKEAFSGNISLPKMVEIIKLGVGAAIVHKMFHVQRTELKALKEQLAKRKASEPALDAGSTNGHSERKQGPMTESELFQDRMEAFNSALASRTV